MPTNDPFGIETGGGTATLAPPAKADPFRIDSAPAPRDPFGIESHAGAKPDPLGIERPTAGPHFGAAHVDPSEFAMSPDIGGSHPLTAEPPAPTGLTPGQQQAVPRIQQMMRPGGMPPIEQPPIGPDLANAGSAIGAGFRKTGLAVGEMTMNTPPSAPPGFAAVPPEQAWENARPQRLAEMGQMDRQRDVAAQEQQAATEKIKSPAIRTVAPVVGTLGPMMAAGAVNPFVGAGVAFAQTGGDVFDAVERHQRQQGVPQEQRYNTAGLAGTGAGVGAGVVSLAPGGQSAIGTVGHGVGSGVGFDLSDQVAQYLATGKPIDWKQTAVSGGFGGVLSGAMRGLHIAFKGKPPQEHVDAVSRATTPEEIQAAVEDVRKKLAPTPVPALPQPDTAVPAEASAGPAATTPPPVSPAAPTPKTDPLGIETSPENKAPAAPVVNPETPAQGKPTTTAPPVVEAMGGETTATPVARSRAQQEAESTPATKGYWSRQRRDVQNKIAARQQVPDAALKPFEGESWAENYRAGKVKKAARTDTAAAQRPAMMANLKRALIEEHGPDIADTGSEVSKQQAYRDNRPELLLSDEKALELAQQGGADSPARVILHNINELAKNPPGTKIKSFETDQLPDGSKVIMNGKAKPLSIEHSNGEVVNDIRGPIPQTVYGTSVLPPPSDTARPSTPAPDERVVSKAEMDALNAPMEETSPATGQQFRVSGPEGKFYLESRAPKGKWQTASKYGETFPTKEAAGARLAELQGGESFPRKGQPISPSETGIAGGADEGPTAAAYSGGTPETTTDTPNWFGSKREQLAAKLHAIRDGVQRFSGRMFPTMTRLARPSGEAAARYVASPIYAKEAAPQISYEIINGPDASRGWFGKVKLDPETDRLAGAVRVEDALRGTKDKFIKQARAASAEAQKAKTAEGRTAAVELYKDAMASAGRVKTLVGAEGSPFKTEAEYQGAKAKTADIQKRYGEWAKGEPEANYRASQDITPEEDLPNLAHELEGHTNLIAVDPETVDKKNTIRVSEAGRGNLRNPLDKPSPFARERKGTAAAYDIRLSQMIRNTLGRGTERANQSRLYDQLVADGLAVKGKPTDRPTIDGKPTRPIDLKRRTVVTKGGSFAQNEVLHVRTDVYPELRRALNVDEKAYIPIVSEAGNIATRTALASFVESSSHVANQAGALFQGAGVRRMLVNLPLRTVQLIRGNPEIYARSLELARIGAERDTAQLTKNPLTWTGKLIDFTDKAGRLVIEDAVRSRQARGLVPNTETAVRDAVNAFGQYNARAQAGVIAAARETGLGPFATAASNFYAMGMRAMTLDPGMGAASRGAAVRLRAEVLARYVGTLGLVAAANYLKWGRVDGGPGVPFGALRTGTDDKGNAKYVNVFKLTPAGRGYRDSGAEALVDSVTRDKTAGQTIDAVAPAIAKGPVRAFEGPIVNAAAVAATGHSAEGYPIAKKAPPGESQVLENLKAAGKQLNPMVRSATDTRGNWTDQLGKFAPKTARARSDAERMVSDILKARGEAEYTAEQEQRFNARRDYADKMRAGDQQARAALAADKTLTPQDKVRARDMARMTRLQYDMKHDSLTAEEAVKVYQAATDQERQQIRTLVIGKIARSSSVSPQRRNELRRAVTSSATRPAA